MDHRPLWHADSMLDPCQRTREEQGGEERTRWVKEAEEEVGRSKASEGSLWRHPVSFTWTPLEKRGCPGQEQNRPCFFFNMTVALTSSFMTPLQRNLNFLWAHSPLSWSFSFGFTSVTWLVCSVSETRRWLRSVDKQTEIYTVSSGPHLNPRGVLTKHMYSCKKSIDGPSRSESGSPSEKRERGVEYKFIRRETKDRWCLFRFTSSVRYFKVLNFFFALTLSFFFFLCNLKKKTRWQAIKLSQCWINSLW